MYLPGAADTMLGAVSGRRMARTRGRVLIVSDRTAQRAPITILIPTKNEEVNLPHALASVIDWAADVFVLDSGSTDRTEQIAREAGAHFVFHPWEGYARQKNWGLDNLPIRTRWVFILDADEVITPPLRDELIAIATADTCPENGFYVNRYLLFLGRRIRHCGYYPSWNVRFFRHGKARYEDREVHEHMIVDGRVGYLRGLMEHYDRRGLAYFIAKHNEYSTLEAREIFRIQQDQASGTMDSGFWSGPVARRRWIKRHIWPRVPARSFVRWFYMYILRLGILDGWVGIHFCFLIAVYEHQITLKLAELYREKQCGDGVRPVTRLIPPQAAATDATARGLAQQSAEAPAKPQPPPDPTPATDNAVAADYRRRFGADTRDAVKWPYPKHVYVLRFLWSIVWCTLWKVCWRRIPILRTLLLRLFGARVGRVAMSASTWVQMPWELRIGDYCLVGPRTHLYNLGGLSIGDHTVISQDVYICGGTHDYTDPTYPLLRKEVTIGSYVWIAAGAFIHPGVSIGEGAVVGARAVVTRDVPPWTIVSGNPAKVVKQRVMKRVAGREAHPADPEASA